MPDWAARVIRTIIQLVAAGALTALTDQLARDVDPLYIPYIYAGYALLVTACQNYAEQAGWIKTTLKPPASNEQPVEPTQP